MKKTLLLFALLCIITSVTACKKEQIIECYESNEATSDLIAQESNISEYDNSIEAANELKLTIARSIESSPSIENDKFYATDKNGKLYRVLFDGDKSMLSESLEIYVIYSDIRAISNLEIQTSDWKPTYEITATYVGLIARSNSK